MVPNPFFQKVIVKVITSFAKSFRSAYSSTLRKNNAANGKKVYNFDWNDIFKHHKLNVLNYLNFEKVKAFNPFENLKKQPEDGTSKSNIHKMSQQEALKILAIESETQPTLKQVMEQYLFLYSKNKPENGGSAYIQAKILNAKDMLVEQLGGNSAEMQWREINGFLDDENLVFDKKPEAQKDVKDAQNEILESTLEAEPENKELNEEEELRKQEEKLKQSELSDEESSDEEEELKEKEEKKEGEEDKKDNQVSKDADTSLDGELGKYSEENPEEHENHEKEEHQNDDEVEELMKAIESKKEQSKKKK